MTGYPAARRDDVTDVLHGRKVADPYRWLEDANSDDTEAWSAAQDRLARSYLDSLPGRDRMRSRLHELLPGAVSAPHQYHRRLFFTRREADQEHAVLLVREGDDERVLVDVNRESPDFTTTLDDFQPSKDGERLAYQVSEGGTESKALRVLDVASGDLVEGPIPVGRACPVAWLPGAEAYYYVRPADGVSEFDRRVWLHRVGAEPATDELVFGEGRDKSTYYELSLSRDGRWLLVGCWLGTAPRNDLYLADLAGDGELRVVHEGLDAQSFGGVRDGKLYLFTDLDAPRNRLVVADPSQPEPQGWRDLVPQSDLVLQDYALTDTTVVAVHLRDVKSEVSVRDRESGDLRGALALPGLGIATVRSAPTGGEDVWFDYTDFVTPSLVLHAETPASPLTAWASAGAPERPSVHVRQEFYESGDGTRIPIFVLSPDDRAPGAPRPTILYGYGGFNVPLTPAYSATATAWVEAGGVYAIANLRGGSEYGEEWHRAGMRDKKQNVFDDFVAAAQWLVSQGWTTESQLAISGGSNGGLLVGAALTQNPALFAAVHCSAPLLDMVRYEHFGLGITWNDEYGSASDPGELEWLLSYSPYHRVREGVRYPATLFTVFEGDTRVDPLHARKMCAALQHATSADPAVAPILIRRERDVGHSSRSKSRTVELQVDALTFLAAATGLALD